MWVIFCSFFLKLVQQTVNKNETDIKDIIYTSFAFTAITIQVDHIFSPWR